MNLNLNLRLGGRKQSEVVPPELIINGTFDVDLTSWTVAATATQLWVSGENEITINGTGDGVKQSVSGMEASTLYNLVIKHRAGTYTGALRVIANGGTKIVTTVDATTTTQITSGTGTSFGLTITRDVAATGTCYIDNVSLIKA